MKMVTGSAVAVLVLAAVSFSTTALAGQIVSKKVAQWGDPLTPPHSRTSCANIKKLGSAKLCVGWETQWQHMEVEGFLNFNGPDHLDQDAVKAVEDCAEVGAAAAGVLTIATDGAAAVAAAEPAFIACLKVKGVQELDKYSVAFKTHSHWTDYH